MVFRPVPVCLLFALALASMFKLAILFCALRSNSSVSLAFVSAKVSCTFLTIGGTREGLVGVGDEYERKTRRGGPPGG